MSKDLPPAGKKRWLKGLGGHRGQRILRRVRGKKWIRENEKKNGKSRGGD